MGEKWDGVIYLMKPKLQVVTSDKLNNHPKIVPRNHNPLIGNPGLRGGENYIIKY